jgi:hypothetical protein
MVWPTAVVMDTSITPALIQFDARIIARPFCARPAAARQLHDGGQAGLLSRRGSDA